MSYGRPKLEVMAVEEDRETPGQHVEIETHHTDEKMPLFLIKLWNIVEDPTYQDIVRWDEVRTDADE